MQYLPVAAFVLIAGCVSTPDTLPTTAQGCKAEFDETISRARSQASLSGGPGTSSGVAIVRGAAEARYNSCLARLANGGATALPDVGGVGQRVETVTVGNGTVQTYTYGNPPPRTGAAHGVLPRKGRQCRATLSGGTGYTCL